jgi:hypothetical protein
MSNSSALPRITVYALILIVCIIAIARVSLATKDEISIETYASKEFIKDSNLNKSENVIINMLYNVGSLSGSQAKNINDKYVIYLSKYLGSAKVELGTATGDKVADKINDLIAIIKLEQESDIKKMSLDGRGVAINIIEQIYKLCGLKLEHNIQGDIRQISDAEGNALYSSNSLIQKEAFDLNSIVIIVATWACLFTICILIAKKNQLYIKDGKYELDQKRFA